MAAKSVKVVPAADEVQAFNAIQPTEDGIRPNEDEDEIVGEDSARVKGKPRKTCLFEFSNTEAIKDKVRQAKFKPDPYNVHNFYHKSGFFPWLAKHPYFENCTLSVIVVNAFWISVDTDGNTADTMLTAKPIYNVMDTAFFLYFSIEVIVRFLAFKNKLNCLKDGWFKFDITLVLLYAFDPFTIALMAYIQGGAGLNLPTAVLRLFRLARLTRLVRMLRSLPELMVMITGMVTAAASVGYTLGLLMILTYVFAIALRNLVPAAEDPEVCEEKYPLSDGCIEVLYFESVPEAMHNLIIFGTFLDALSDFMWAVKEQSPPCLVLLWIYIALASLTVMNMLIGVLCEVISAVAQEEKESMMVDKVQDKFGAIVEELDENGDGTISWNEFQKILDFPEALKALESLNVNPESMIDMAEDVFFEDGEALAISFDDFMEMILNLRGGQQATVENIMGLGKRFTSKFMTMNSRMGDMENKVDTVTERMTQIDSKLDQVLSFLKADAPAWYF